MARLAAFFNHCLWDFRSSSLTVEPSGETVSWYLLLSMDVLWRLTPLPILALLRQRQLCWHDFILPGFRAWQRYCHFLSRALGVFFLVPVALTASWPWFHPFSYPSLQIIHGVLFIFQISPTSIFLCKVSASGVPQGSPSGTCLVIFFKFLGCGCSWSKNSVVGDEKNNGHPLPLHTFLLPAPSCT